MKGPDPLTKTTLVEQAYQRIRAMIIEGELEPGQPLVQDELARKLGISRTPVMHAIRELENDGLASRNNTHRVYVRELTLDDMIAIWEIREALETLACKYVTPVITESQIDDIQRGFEQAVKAPDQEHEYRHMDNIFHMSIAELCPRRDLRDILVRSGFMGRGLLKGLLRPPMETLPEHLAILEGLRERDPEKATRAMGFHLRMSLEHLKKQKQGG